MFFDKNLLTPCPILKPNEKEFQDPIGYLSSEAIKRLGLKYGILKVVPPENWKPNFTLSSNFKFHVRKQVISDLGITTRSRDFFRENVNRFLKMRRKRQLKLFFEVEGKKIYYYDLYILVENLGGYLKMDLLKWSEINEKFDIHIDSEAIKNEYETSIRYYANYLNHKGKVEFPDSDSEDEYDNCLICGDHNDPSETLLCDNCDNPFHMKCLDPPLNSVPATNWFCDKCLIGTGEYGFDEDVDTKYSLPEFYKMCKDFDQKFIESYNDGLPLNVDTIEQKFWSFVDIEKSDLEVKYGADIHNLKPGEISGFPMINSPGIELNEENKYYINHPWNLTKLPFAKGSLLNYINTSISGMTVPWIYIGSLLSTFCWHVEDHYTLSANYCHFGATKKWYGIPSKYADKFEKLMKDSAPDLFQKQPDLLHQLVTLLSPMKLIENGIPCMYADQQPNEFVITFPKVYHAGFNCGFNFNEAVNFAMDEWLNYGERSISDYKPIKKENVFNFYELVENIIKEYNEKGTHNYRLLKYSLKSFEDFTKNQIKMLKLLEGRNFTKEFKEKSYKAREFDLEQKGEVDEDEEDDLCHNCKSKLGFQYFEKFVNNQLLTPDSSPKEEFIKREAIKQEATKIAESTSDELTNLNKPTCMMDEFDRLINQAKQQIQDDDDNNKRRSSKRLQKQTSQEPIKKRKVAGMKRHPKVIVNDNKYCLECVLNDDNLTSGKIIYQNDLKKQQDMILEAKRKLERSLILNV
ncbi:unnamed protein product [Candida verbasci]|uniref:Histone demethylase JHD2 n=1 Tax=Candida verbasci TaxID=1227364 RepID=A0A9W4TXT9_9ASCO|nr:unnamed protein product [Candida verbasci]